MMIPLFSLLAPLLFLSALIHAQAPPLFSVKTYQEELIRSWRGQPDIEARRQTWLDENHRNWDLYLKTIYDVDDKDRPAWEVRISTWLQGYGAADMDPDRLERNYRSIKKNLPAGFELLGGLLDIKAPIDVYFIPAIVPFNGKEFIIEGRPALAINVSYNDLGSSETIRSLIVHEGTHVLHFRAHDKDEVALLRFERLGIALREGLAVAAVKKLFPGRDEAFWTYLSQTYYRRCAERLEEFAGKMLADLTLPPREFDNKYFRARADDGDVPPRCGYLIAYRAVDRIAAGKPLQEILSMPSRDYQPLLVQTLGELAGKRAKR